MMEASSSGQSPKVPTKAKKQAEKCDIAIHENTILLATRCPPAIADGMSDMGKELPGT